MRKLIILFLLIATHAAAQRTVQLPVSFGITYGDAPLTTGNTYTYHDSAIQFSTLRFYVSGIRLMNQKDMVWQENNSYHLIDIEDTATLKLALNIPESLQYDAVKFNLGIDSITNVSGALKGDLDPTKGMYWAWQSGYINLKLEGISPLCNARKHEFQFHLGGYAAPFASMQTVTLPLSRMGVLNIVTDIAQLMSAIDVSVQNSIMVPGDDAVALSRRAAAAFSIKK